MSESRPFDHALGGIIVDVTRLRARRGTGRGCVRPFRAVPSPAPQRARAACGFRSADGCLPIRAFGGWCGPGPSLRARSPGSARPEFPPRPPGRNRRAIMYRRPSVSASYSCSREKLNVELRRAAPDARRCRDRRSCAEDLAEHAERSRCAYCSRMCAWLAAMWPTSCPSAKASCDSSSISAHQLPGDVDIAAGDRKGVLDRRIEHCEMKRLARVGDARKGADAATDRFDISRARAGFGAAKLLRSAARARAGLRRRLCGSR